MSIVKMKKLSLVALSEDRDRLLKELLHLGCVEVREPEEIAEEVKALLKPSSSALSEKRLTLVQMQQALDTLAHYSTQKSGGFLTPRAPIGEAELLDRGALLDAMALSDTINAHAKEIAALNTRETRLEAERLSLLPWEAETSPLECSGTAHTSLLLGTFPASVHLTEVMGALQETTELVVLTELSTDREQHYVELLCHKSVEASVLDTLRPFGFAFSQLRDKTGTAKENIKAIETAIGECQVLRKKEEESLSALGDRKWELKVATDRLAQVISTEATKERLLGAGKILYLEGWLPATEESRLLHVLGAFDCAYDIVEPTEEEYPVVPVKLKNNAFTRPLNMVTEMYSLPAYDGVDPNPLMAPFFILFYGIMMADMGYGLLMILFSLIVLKKARPTGTMQHLFGLMGLCGVSTFIMGAVTGGFFSDFLTQFIKLVSPGTEFALPALFTPLNDTLMILIGSMALGFVQIVTGMAISFVEKMKKKEYMDAFFEEITWWVVFVGIGLFATNITPFVLYGGIVLVILGPVVTQKGFGKITGIFGSLYNHVTGYFGDILSYSRLMALMLAGSVIAQVFNTLGAIPGNVVIFLIISIAGNTLNFALNLLGCYVHDLRLQCLEYFGKFYKDGGRPYKPYHIQTNYVEVVKD